MGIEPIFFIMIESAYCRLNLTIVSQAGRCNGPRRPGSNLKPFKRHSLSILTCPACRHFHFLMISYIIYILSKVMLLWKTFVDAGAHNLARTPSLIRNTFTACPINLLTLLDCHQCSCKLSYWEHRLSVVICLFQRAQWHLWGQNQKKCVVVDSTQTFTRNIYDRLKNYLCIWHPPTQTDNQQANLLGSLWRLVIGHCCDPTILMRSPKGMLSLMCTHLLSSQGLDMAGCYY